MLESMEGLQRLQYHPVLMMTPTEHGQAIINAGASAVRETARHQAQRFNQGPGLHQLEAWQTQGVHAQGKT